MILFGGWGVGQEAPTKEPNYLEAFKNKMLCLKNINLRSIIEQRNSDPLLENYV